MPNYFALNEETESALRQAFTEKGWEFSRPVLFPASRSNLVVMRGSEKIDVLAVFESKTNLWIWNYYYPPLTDKSVLVTTESDPPDIFVLPTAVLVTLGEENARRWELREDGSAKESQTTRRVWKDQISDWQFR